MAVSAPMHAADGHERHVCWQPLRKLDGLRKNQSGQTVGRFLRERVVATAARGFK